MAERELRSIVDTVLRLAKSIGVAETEVHVDETISALTRFANNGIHPERCGARPECVGANAGRAAHRAGHHESHR